MKVNNFNNLPTKNIADGQSVPLTVSLEGTGAATAWITGNKIIIECAAVQHAKYVNVSTPLNFDVLDVHTIHGNATACSVQVANTTGAITDALAVAATDKVIDRALTVDDLYYSFSNGDDDLRLIIGTAAFTGKVVIIIDK